MTTSERDGRHQRKWPLVVIGWDPGPTFAGWSVIESTQTGRQSRFIDGGTAVSHFARYQEVLEKYAFSDPMKGRCVVAVEVPGGYVHEKCRGPELLETAFQAGRIFSAAQALGVRCFRATADEVRRALYGKRSGKLMKADAAVAAALPLFILGLPKRTNVHVRDSLAVAHAATLVMS